jgi:hypothetical protein
MRMPDCGLGSHGVPADLLLIVCPGQGAFNRSVAAVLGNDHSADQQNAKSRRNAELGTNADCQCGHVVSPHAQEKLTESS